MLRLTLAVLAAASAGMIPFEDWRNIDTPDPETHFKMPGYASRREWERQRVYLRRQILSAAGLLPMPEKTPLNPRVVWRAERNGVLIESVLLETMPGYFLGGNVYRPQVIYGKLPAVLSPHGHWKRGRIENEPSYSVPALGINLARQGYIVFTWDMVGYNDTKQTNHSFGGWREELWSFNPLGVQLWNSIRAVDYVRSLRDVDHDRIGVTGASGGGTQTFLLTAVDQRIKCSAPVNMISAYAQGADPCEEAPGLRVGSFNVEFAAMAAPRPMLVVSCTGDWTRHTPTEEFPAIRRIYGLFGAPDHVANFHLDAKHNYNRESREAVYRFLAPHLLRRTVDTEERDIDLPDPGELLALSHARLPAGALDYDGVFREWRADARRRASRASDTVVRESLRAIFGADWPERFLTAAEGKRLVISRPGRRDRVSGVWMPGSGTPTVVVHPAGADAARQSPEVRRMEADGRALYLVDVFQTGAAKNGRDRSGAWFLSYNRTDDAHRVQDILTALAYADAHSRGRLRLLGLNGAAVWCTFAAAIAPVPVDLQADLKDFEGTDEQFRDRFYVPGIQHAGGLEAALRLIAARLADGASQRPRPAEPAAGL